MNFMKLHALYYNITFIEVIFVTPNVTMIYLHVISHCLEAGNSSEVFLPMYQSTEQGLTQY